jgi:predicted O-methyltransferase YrrM
MIEEVRKIFENVTIPEEDIAECGFDKVCYEVYNYLGKIFKPKSILEIGTRRGYSLVAMTKDNPSIEFVISCDNESYIEDSQTEAEANIKVSGYKGVLDMWRVPSTNAGFKKRLEILLEKLDLIHIDGDHDKPGVILDLELCLPHLADKGLMIVDDYLYIIDVKEATDEFVKKYNLGMIVLDTYRGTALIKRR